MGTLGYQAGFGNEFASEAVEGALPKDQNSPQKTPFGLYVEEVNGTAFTAPRGVSRSSWTYRIRPSVTHKPFHQIHARLVRSGPFDEAPATPNQLRWRPLRVPDEAADFVDGLITLGGNGDPAAQGGAAIHVYGANRSMHDRFFYDADGELLIVPQLGALRLHTEFGILEVQPAEIALVPRGIKFRVELVDAAARGFVLENYGLPFRLPDLGPIGTFGLANARDFLAPVAAFDDREADMRIVAKYGGAIWEAEIDHSPLDIVAWRGNYVPFKYDLRRFQCINTVTFDHPDPSIYCVLASPTAVPGTSNVEFGCFPPRWIVAEHTFRPPPFHRNVASEFVALLQGSYIGKGESFAPGSASLHNCMAGHGPDADTYQRATSSDLQPQYLDDTMTFIIETQLPIRPTKWAIESDLLDRDYYKTWQGLTRRFRVNS
jgi:homogentisate 1,2-dioxygenase